MISGVYSMRDRFWNRIQNFRFSFIKFFLFYFFRIEIFLKEREREIFVCCLKIFFNNNFNLIFFKFVIMFFKGVLNKNLM